MRMTGFAWMMGGTLLLAAAGATAQDLKVGFVSTARIEAESAQAARAREDIKNEFEPRQKQIVELQRQIQADRERFDRDKATMPPDEMKSLGNSIANRMRESDQMVFSMQADLEQRRKERSIKLLEVGAAAISAVAKQGNFDLVVHEAAFVRPTIDITDAVLKEMASRAGN